MSDRAPTLDVGLPEGDDLATHPMAQWRLAEVQLANWGTFHDAIYRIPIARRGHLLTGPSGSGKSSLLDAISSVLVPDKWLSFNQAAQGAAGGQRSTTSYVRGAWSKTVHDDEDRVVSRFLRPGTAWSGIVLRYEDGAGATASLARLFVVRPSDTAPSDLCLLLRSSVDLADLQPYVAAGIQARKLKSVWPDAVITTNGSHGLFYRKVRALFGIAHESALQLLHKTQSAKSLDSLDRLFRDYMLETPRTFEMADTAVVQFGELRDAHARVVLLRRQRDHLIRVSEASSRLDAAAAAAALSARLSDSVIPFTRHESLRLGRDERDVLRERRIAAESEEEAALRARDSADEAVDIARRRADERGGAEADQLRRRIADADVQAAATRDREQTLVAQLRTAGIPRAPASRGEFAELMAQIDREIAVDPSTVGPTYEQHERLSAARRERERLVRERDSVRRSGIALPERLVRVRSGLADAVGLREAELPFAAELLGVRDEFAEWTGAIERVLRPLSLALLVRTQHLRDVRRWVDAHPLGVRLVFEEVGSGAVPPRRPSTERSLVHRVTVSAGPFEDWLQGQLSDRFDYACVDSPDNLYDHTRAVTIRGQVKTSRTRYEKDDRTAIDDRREWVLGDREEKLEAIVESLAVAESELAAAEADVAAAQSAFAASARRVGALETIRSTTWASVDVVAADEVAANLRAILEDLSRDRGDLRAALDELERSEAERKVAEERLTGARLGLRELTTAASALESELAELEDGIADGTIPPLDDDTRSLLGERFRAVRRSMSRQSLDRTSTEVYRELTVEHNRALGAQQTESNTLTALLATFTRDFVAASADLTPRIEDRGGFLDLLDDIVAHDLPSQEDNFRRLLRDRSTDLMGQLNAEIRRAPREIADRIVPVNDSLRRSRFDEGRWLRLRVKQRWSETVREFVQDLTSISEGKWDDDLATDERRFATLESLMDRLDSSDHVDRTWRIRCLDTRQHVTFLAEEIDAQGAVEATYDSGAAMSGGQQQKLVVFCLAAALRYQLADAEDLLPRYGTVVLDEAFDKADSRYTRMAIEIFVEFGFQLVLATPQKLLQTIEPYVGAVTSIENPDRKLSVVADVVWNRDGA